MKVLHLIYPGLGGVTPVSLSIIDFLKRKNLKIENLILFHGVEKLLILFKLFCYNKSIKFIYIKKIFFFPFLSLFKILNFIISEKPKIIISHELCSLELMIYKIFYDSKIIFVFHTPFKFSLIHLRISIKFIFSLIFFDKIIFVTTEKKKYKKIPILGKKIKIIENGINTTFYNLKKNKKKNNKIFKIGSAFRFTPVKRTDLIIDFCKQYRNFLKKNKIQFSIAGAGPTFNNFLNDIKNYNIGNLIKCKKYLNNFEMKKWLHTLDAFILLTDRESLSTSILQSMSVPLPTIASRVSGNIDIGKKKYKNTNCIILTDNKIKDIKDKISLIIDNHTFRNSLKRSARKVLIRNYSEDVMSMKYFKLIKSLI